MPNWQSAASSCDHWEPTARSAPPPWCCERDSSQPPLLQAVHHLAPAVRDSQHAAAALGKSPNDRLIDASTSAYFPLFSQANCFQSPGDATSSMERRRFATSNAVCTLSARCHLQSQPLLTSSCPRICRPGTTSSQDTLAVSTCPQDGKNGKIGVVVIGSLLLHCGGGAQSGKWVCCVWPARHPAFLV